jgi:hypothetical protein
MVKHVGERGIFKLFINRKIDSRLKHSGMTFFFFVIPVSIVNDNRDQRESKKLALAR